MQKSLTKHNNFYTLGQAVLIADFRRKVCTIERLEQGAKNSYGKALWPALKRLPEKQQTNHSADYKRNCLKQGGILLGQIQMIMRRVVSTML